MGRACASSGRKRRILGCKRQRMVALSGLGLAEEASQGFTVCTGIRSKENPPRTRLPQMLSGSKRDTLVSSRMSSSALQSIK